MKIEFDTVTVAIITGASKGIGLACARAMAAAGARCVLVARNQSLLDEAVAGLPGPPGHHISLTADLSDGAASAALVDKVENEIGPIAVLINSAGAAQRFSTDELSPEAFAQGMNAKYFPTVHLMEPVAKRMAARKKGGMSTLSARAANRHRPFISRAAVPMRR